MRVHVAFTPSEAATAELGIFVDVVRATSSNAQALASGYRRVLCCAEVEQARALRTSPGGESVLGGAERTDAAIAAVHLAQAYPRALDGLNARTYGPAGLEADIEWCARESALEVVPRLARLVDGAAEI